MDEEGKELLGLAEGTELEDVVRAFGEASKACDREKMVILFHQLVGYAASLNGELGKDRS